MQRSSHRLTHVDAIEFWSICSANGIVLSREQVAQFERYVEDLLYWNERVNLISRRDTDQIWLHHILHSVSIMFTGQMPKSGRVLDIGTGGGLPGIPLKIINPKFDVTLLDSIAKKVQTVGMIAGHITKHGMRAERERAEELANREKLKGPYDVIVSRATAPLVDLMKWSRPVLKPEGLILTLKGGDLTEEIRQAQTKFKDAEITVIDLHVGGCDWFEREEKRLVRVRWDAPFSAPAAATATVPAETDDNAQARPEAEPAAMPETAGMSETAAAPEAADVPEAAAVPPAASEDTAARPTAENAATMA